MKTILIYTGTISKAISIYTYRIHRQ